MPVAIELNKGHVPVKIYTRDVDERTVDQLVATSQLPIIHSHVAAMPDVHLGLGATVGSVIPTKRAVIPAAVGVDIGCGMIAARLNKRADQLPDNLNSVRRDIEARVPTGRRSHKEDHAPSSPGSKKLSELANELTPILDKAPSIRKNARRSVKRMFRDQFGTLGGGNHFVELCLDENDSVWIMLHSGSRGIGNRIGRYYIDLAREDMREHIKNLPDKDLAYLEEGTSHFRDYMDAVEWAQRYAWENRQEMFRLVVDALKRYLPDVAVEEKAINCHHNYVTKERHFDEDVWVTRKGAIRAGKGELGIIPGSMGAASYIVKGLGNEDSFLSCSHGAGRRMSRTAARKKYTRADMREQTQGIECRKDRSVIDEIPAAYKDIDSVIENQSDLASVVHRLKQVICVKG